MIDTNILLDWLLDRDEQRSKLVDRLFTKQKRLHVPDLVLVELGFVLERYYKLPRDIVVQNIARVLNEPALRCNQTLFQSALVDYAEHLSLSILDCCLLRHAELSDDLPLWTLDKKLVNQSSGRAKLLTTTNS